jgi:hypothetical protein
MVKHGRTATVVYFAVISFGRFKFLLNDPKQLEICGSAAHKEGPRHPPIV